MDLVYLNNKRVWMNLQVRYFYRQLHCTQHFINNGWFDVLCVAVCHTDKLERIDFPERAVNIFTLAKRLTKAEETIVAPATAGPNRRSTQRNASGGNGIFSTYIYVLYCPSPSWYLPPSHHPSREIVAVACSDHKNFRKLSLCDESVLEVAQMQLFITQIYRHSERL